MSTTHNAPSFAQLLESAVNEPGKISAAFRMFHSYSIGNQLLALEQCSLRKIEPGPLATFPAWKAKGRNVRKGEKALVLCMPVTMKRRSEVEGEPDAVFKRFVFRPNWFVISQTEGAAVEPEPIPGWDVTRALATLTVEQKPFDLTDGNIGGYARGRTITVNPMHPNSARIMFHELAHVVLGHTVEGEMIDNANDRTPRNQRELEAEAVAMLCCAALGMNDGVEFSRGYIQHWWGQGNAVPEASAQKIFKATDSILKAGRE